VPKKLIPSPRSSRFNRFQTALFGVTFVHTAVDAHFDPYAEKPASINLTEPQMEQVPRIEVPER
jgi:hypothetical protein